MDVKQQGPNVKRLIIHKMSVLMIPPGSGKASHAIGLEALTKPGNLLSVCREASAWVEQALAAVKASGDNPYGDGDEAIAAVILSEIEKRTKRPVR